MAKNSRMIARRLLPELMDQPELDVDEHRNALFSLARINRLSQSAAILWPPLHRLARALNRPIRILDVASGAGDVAITLWQKAHQSGIDLEISGVDVSPVAVEYACKQAKKAQVPVHFACLDVLRNELPGHYDATLSSLFLHHLTAPNAAHLLTKMAAATLHLLLINDLRRTFWGYLLAQFVCRVLTQSRVVRVDGPRSVAGAFTERELHQIFTNADLHNVQIARRWPFRMLAVWRPYAG